MIDNEDDKVSFEGEWSEQESDDAYNGTYRQTSLLSSGSVLYNITFIGSSAYYDGTLHSNLFQVEIFYPDVTPLATSSQEVKINLDGGEIATVIVDFTEDADQWNFLGTFLLSESSSIAMSGGGIGTRRTIADAFRFTCNSFAIIFLIRSE